MTQMILCTAELFYFETPMKWNLLINSFSTFFIAHLLHNVTMWLHASSITKNSKWKTKCVTFLFYSCVIRIRIRYKERIEVQPYYRDIQISLFCINMCRNIGSIKRLCLYQFMFSLYVIIYRTMFGNVTQWIFCF